MSCATAPLVTWENFGEGFVRSNCQACHASTAADRKEAPVEVAFDTEQETLSWTDRILERSTGENASMPPAGGVTDEDKYLLEVWLRCGAE